MRLGYFVPRGGAAAPARTPGPGYLVGAYYDQLTEIGGNISSVAGAVNRLQLYPFTPNAQLRVDEIGVVVFSQVAGSSVKCLAYAADAAGLPGELLLETGDIATTAPGYTGVACDLTFEAGQIYYLGVRHMSTVQLRSAAATLARTIGPALGEAAASQTATAWQRVVTYADPAPDPFAPIAGEMANVATQLIRFRAAAT